MTYCYNYRQLLTFCTHVFAALCDNMPVSRICGSAQKFLIDVPLHVMLRAIMSKVKERNVCYTHTQGLKTSCIQSYLLWGSSKNDPYQQVSNSAMLGLKKKKKKMCMCYLLLRRLNLLIKRVLHDRFSVWFQSQMLKMFKSPILKDSELQVSILLLSFNIRSAGDVLLTTYRS